MMRILVTGGAGFIGSWLVQRLLGVPRTRVTVVDDLSSNPIPYKQWREEMDQPDRYINRGAGSELVFEQMEIADYALNDHEEFDQIYHLASPVGPAGILKHRGKMLPNIVLDTMAVLDLARRSDAKLIYVSTSEVYGGGQHGACTDTMDRIIQAKVTTRLEYAVGKLAGETLVANTDDVEAVIVRPFNVAGPRQSSVGGFVIPRFVEQALAGKPLTIFGSGHQIRAFTHVWDIAEGLMVAAHYGQDKQVYNLGFRENRTTINALAHEVLIQTESKAGVTHIDGKQVYGPLYEEANDKWPEQVRHSELRWWPQYSLANIVQHTILYMREHSHVLP